MLFLVFRDYQLAILRGQLSWILFCNHYGLVLYQTKCERGLYFLLGRRFLNPINNAFVVIVKKVFIELAGAGPIGKERAIFQRPNIGNKNMNSISRCQNNAC